MSFIAHNVARNTGLPVETVAAVLEETARELRGEHDEAAEALADAARAAAPVDPNAPTLSL